MPVTYAADGTLGTITLDNPPANSYDIGMVRELAGAIDTASADAGVRVVVLRSASERFFSAGADVKRFLANDVDANMDMIRLAHEALASIARSPKLFVAWSTTCISGTTRWPASPPSSIRPPTSSSSCRPDTQPLGWTPWSKSTATM